MQKVKAIYDTIRIIMAILFLGVTIIDITGILNGGSVYDDELTKTIISTKAEEVTMVQIIALIAAVLYVIVAAIRLARISRSHLLAWGLRLFDIAVVAYLLMLIMN